MTPLSGTVLLTGASGGIGHAIARAVAPRAAELILTGRRSELLEPLAAELGARVIACDLSVRRDVERLPEQAGRVDVLIANAGVPASGALVELAQEDIDRMLEVNLRAPIALVRALAPAMIERGRGHIVLMSSLQGKAAVPSSSVYSATKFGLRGFGYALRDELRGSGVGVSTVFPGFIRDAGMFAEAGVTLPRGVGTRTPDQVAAAVVRVIESNRAELDVAPLGLRVGAAFSGLAPGVAATLSRRMGSTKIATDMARGQANKR
jgi:short-subunit dehydrogenase